MRRVLELGLISLWMKRLRDCLLSWSRAGQEVLPVEGKAVTWIPPAFRSMRETSTNQYRCQKLEWVGQRRCGWQGTGAGDVRVVAEGAGLPEPRGGGSEGVTHPEQVVQWQQCLHFWGEGREGKRGKAHRTQQGKFQKFSLRVEEHWNKGPKSLLHFYLWRLSKINRARLWTIWSDLRVRPALTRGLDKGPACAPSCLP